MTKPPAHFEGKEAISHVIEARIKGREASQEMHGTEMPGYFAAAIDAAKETAIIGMIFYVILKQLMLSSSEILISLFVFFFFFILWKIGRAARFGWARLERLHRLIEEERWEIEHHRQQEREELEALYKAKGFSGKLLTEVVDVLMADDNRLLQVMLEEELGLTLESYEHPLIQGLGAGIGVLISSFLLICSSFLFPPYGIAIIGFLIICIFASISAKREKSRISHSVIWNLGISALSWTAAFFTMQLLSKAFL